MSWDDRWDNPDFDFGGGVLGRKVGWAPDREIQTPEFLEKYKDIPDQDFVMLSLRFADGCEGACSLDVELNRVTPTTVWQVISWEPLTLNPSIKQVVPSSNDSSSHEHHGHIIDGVWIEC